MIDELGWSKEEGIFKKKEGPAAHPHCNNCREAYQYHVDQKCPFQASTYDMGSEPYLWGLDDFTFREEPGLAVGNLAAVRKIKLEEEDKEERKYVRDD